MLALVVSLLAAAPSGAAALASDDPPVRVSLNQGNYFQRGDKARVRVELGADGYLVVLRADASGRVRVLFPLDPGDDDFVRGGRKFEIRGRGDRETFAVDDREGTGLVLAAWSETPFRFDGFVRGDHWDYRVLSIQDADADPEAALLDIAQRMAPDGHFEYDAVSYTVASNRYYSGSRYPYYSHVHVGFRYGWPYHYSSYSSCYDPFWYDSFYCGSYYDPFFYRPYRYRPFSFTGGVVIVNRPRYRGGLLIDRVRPRSGGGLTFKARVDAPQSVTEVGPRLRIPQGTLVNRTTRVHGVPVAPREPTSVRVRNVFVERARPDRVRERPARRESREAEARRPERRESTGGGGSARPAPERRDGGSGRGVDRSAPSRDRGAGVSRGGGGGGGGGGRSAAASSGGGSRSSGSSGGSAPSNGGGRRRP